MGIEGLTATAPLLLAGLTLDALFGDPQVSFHPIRLLGHSLSRLESLFRRLHLDGYAGGCALFLSLAGLWVLLPCLAVVELQQWNSVAGFAAHAFCVYIAFAFRDLIDHVHAVQLATRRNDVPAARAAVALFVGRDTAMMDAAACRRASIESLAESFVDGFLSALFWYVVGGLPALLTFKVVSTMDSMVGYKTERYLRFGWCGARLDDALNYLPARLGWLLLGLAAIPFASLSAVRGWKVGWEQHALIPGPNPGWIEATMAGVLCRRLIGPIWKGGLKVTDLWIGHQEDPPAGSDADVVHALSVTLLAGTLASGFCVVLLLLIR